MTITEIPPVAESEVPPPPAHRKRRGKLIVLGIVGALIIAVGLVAGWYLKTHKPLSQLPGIDSNTTPHYSFSIYGVSRPLGVAVNSSGSRIYVTQSDGPRDVRVFDRSGKQIGTLKPAGPSSGPWHTPVYVAINPKNDDVYVSDRLTSAVYVYNSDGKYLREFDAQKPKLGGSWAPLGVTFDRDGALYVTDVSGTRQRVLVYGPDGKFVRAIGQSEAMAFPNGIAVDKRGRIEVTDSNNGRLLVFDQGGAVTAKISRGVGSGDLGLPRGVAIDGSNRLYVVDSTDHMVRIYRVGKDATDTPSYLGSFGGEGQLDGTFEFPNGIATDSHARIYVTDRENNRVQIWTY